MIGSTRNHCVISGTLLELEPLRYTPAGIARIGCKIRHASTRQEAGMARQVQCDITLLALGEVAIRMSSWQAGQRVQAEGFLAQRSLRSAQLVLHIDNINLE